MISAKDVDVEEKLLALVFGVELVDNWDTIGKPKLNADPFLIFRHLKVSFHLLFTNSPFLLLGFLIFCSNPWLFMLQFWYLSLSQIGPLHFFISGILFLHQIVVLLPLYWWIRIYLAFFDFRLFLLEFGLVFKRKNRFILITSIEELTLVYELVYYELIINDILWLLRLNIRLNVF